MNACSVIIVTANLWLFLLPSIALCLSMEQNSIVMPTRSEDVIRQAANSIGYAFANDGINRQSIRLPLSESMYGDKTEGFVADRAIGWQGGPQETLRYLSPISTELLKQVRTTIPEEKNNDDDDDNNVVRCYNDGGLPPRISEQVLLDFDGSSLLTAESPRGALHDAQALLQPNTDKYYLDTIQKIEEQFSDTPGKAKRLFLLVNPAWRDKSSWGFFGGKRAQEQILDRYETTYVLDQFVMRGRKVSLLKAYPSDWSLFLGDNLVPAKENAAEQTPTLLGTFVDRPKYDQMDALLQNFLSKSA